MKRRSFLATPALVALVEGCGDSVAEEPWILWGDTKDLLVNVTAGGFPLPTVTDQLTKVSYHRPDTWAFLFTAETIAAPVPISAGLFDFTVAFDVITGIGRSRFNTEEANPVASSVFNRTSFVKFRFAFNPGDAILGRKKWSTVGHTPVLDDFDATLRTDPIEFLPAQDIQVKAIANGSGVGAPPSPIKVRVGAFFAPLNHIRPDWFAENVEGFTSELGGR